MNNPKIIKGAALVAVCAILVGGAVAVKAATDVAVDSFERPAFLQKFEKKGRAFTGMAQGDNAVAGEKRLNRFNGEAGQMKMALSEEQKAELELKFEERRSEMEAKHEAMQTALEAGDYQAWLAAVGTDHPWLEQINANNFGRLLEMHKLNKAASSIAEELGLTGLGGHKFGRNFSPTR